MALQNRSDPAGALFVNASRGLFTGNRGIIHDPDTKSLNGRRWTHKAWICCALNYKDRKRDVWGRNGPGGSRGWTELFFLDEVTALAAGHRPCFTCRRADALRYRDAWASGTGKKPGSEDMNDALHRERLLSRREPPQRLSMIDMPGLPDGTVVEAGGDYFALRNRQAMRWSFDGYGKPEAFSNLMRFPVTLVTPRSTVHVLRAGYTPAWHASAS